MRIAARVLVVNGSNVPAYDVRLSRVDGAGQPVRYGLVQAGERVVIFARGDMIKSGRLNDKELMVEFTMRGLQWRTCCDGKARRNWGTH